MKEVGGAVCAHPVLLFSGNCILGNVQIYLFNWGMRRMLGKGSGWPCGKAMFVIGTLNRAIFRDLRIWSLCC